MSSDRKGDARANKKNHSIIWPKISFEICDNDGHNLGVFLCNYLLVEIVGDLGSHLSRNAHII